MLEKSEGEQRLWRPEPGEVDPGGFILKVSPKNNGSQHLVLMTESMAPGDAIPTHKHLEQDEIVLIEQGTIRAHIGDQERDLHAGGMVFIPARTWVSLKSIGTETASIVAIFSAPGFEDHVRCESVLANEKPTTISRSDENECDHLGHVVYKDRGEEGPKSEEGYHTGLPVAPISTCVADAVKVLIVVLSHGQTGTDPATADCVRIADHT